MMQEDMFVKQEEHVIEASAITGNAMYMRHLEDLEEGSYRRIEKRRENKDDDAEHDNEDDDDLEEDEDREDLGDDNTEDDDDIEEDDEDGDHLGDDNTEKKDSE